MLNTNSSGVASIFKNALTSNTSLSKESIVELGKLSKEELNKSKVALTRRDPKATEHRLLKSCWYLEKMIGSLESFTGVSLEKSLAQSNSVREKIETSSDWINTAKESDSYDILADCSEALKLAIDTLLSFAESVDTKTEVNKSKYKSVSEKMIYKAKSSK